MGALLRWLVIALCAFGALAGGYHAYLVKSPRKVLVLLDTSFPMQGALERVPALLHALEGRRYTVYALETDKLPVHEFSDGLHPGRLDAYAPRNLAALATRAGQAPYNEADEVILVSNASPAELAGLPPWRVVAP